MIHIRWLLYGSTLAQSALTYTFKLEADTTIEARFTQNKRLQLTHLIDQQQAVLAVQLMVLMILVLILV